MKGLGKMLRLRRAVLEDIASWMALVELVRDNFPGLETQEAIEQYEKTLIKNVSRNTAICVTLEEKVVGVLIYSINSKCISCMAVHPEYRRHGIASMLVEEMINSFPEGTKISVSTFREGDPLGSAPRALYKKFGFLEGELTIEFGHPNQLFWLNK